MGNARYCVRLPPCAFLAARKQNDWGQTEETYRTSLSQRGAKVSSVLQWEGGEVTYHTEGMARGEHLFAGHAVDLARLAREALVLQKQWGTAMSNAVRI